MVRKLLLVIFYSIFSMVFVFVAGYYALTTIDNIAHESKMNSRKMHGILDYLLIMPSENYTGEIKKVIEHNYQVIVNHSTLDAQGLAEFFLGYNLRVKEGLCEESVECQKQSDMRLNNWMIQKYHPYIKPYVVMSDHVVF